MLLWNAGIIVTTFCYSRSNIFIVEPEYVNLGNIFTFNKQPLA